MLDHVIYPPQYDPRISPIYALNEVDVKAPAASVWRLLVDAGNWFHWFPPEENVAFLGGGRELALGTRYTRVTIGFPMHLVVTECEPGKRLFWATTVDGDATGSTAFHGWVITPSKDGCHVLTEETPTRAVVPGTARSPASGRPLQLPSGLGGSARARRPSRSSAGDLTFRRLCHHDCPSGT